MHEVALVDAGLKTRKPKNVARFGITGRLSGRTTAVCLLLFLVLAAGCDREKISVYKVPKQSALAASMAPADDAAAGPQVQWKTTPSGWTQKQPTESSVLSFAIAGKADKSAELSVKQFSFGGVQPVVLINVIRQNAGLPPFSEEEFSRILQTIPIGAEQGSLMDFTGATSGTNAPATGLMVALLVHDGVTWLFKLAGDAQLVASQKPAMIDFLKSVSIVSGGNASPHAHAMASTNTKRETSGSDTRPPATSTMTPPLESANHPAWTVPTGWKEVPPSQMLLAKFSIPGNGSGGADVTVSSFPGDVGGLLANVNRWRSQVGLTAIVAADLEKSVNSLDVNGVKATLVDVNGTDPGTSDPARLIGVVLPRAGETWFYKLKGDPKTAEQAKDAFLKFVQSVRYPNG